MLPKIDSAVGADLHATVAKDAALMVALGSRMKRNGSGWTFVPAQTALHAAFGSKIDSRAGKEARKINQVRKIGRKGFFEGLSNFTTVADGLDLGAPDPGISIRIDLLRFETHHLGSNDISGTGRRARHDQTGCYRMPGGAGPFSFQSYNTVNDIQLRFDFSLQTDEKPGKGSGVGQCLVVSLLQGAGNTAVEILHTEGHSGQAVGLHLGNIDDEVNLGKDFRQRHGADFASDRHNPRRFCFKIDDVGIPGKRRDTADTKGMIRIVEGAFSDQDLGVGSLEDLAEFLQNGWMGRNRPCGFDRRHQVGFHQDLYPRPERDVQKGEGLFKGPAHLRGGIGIAADTADSMADHFIANSIMKTGQLIRLGSEIRVP